MKFEKPLKYEAIIFHVIYTLNTGFFLFIQLVINSHANSPATLSVGVFFYFKKFSVSKRVIFAFEKRFAYEKDLSN